MSLDFKSPGALRRALLHTKFYSESRRPQTPPRVQNKGRKMQSAVAPLLPNPLHTLPSQANLLQDIWSWWNNCLLSLPSEKSQPAKPLILVTSYPIPQVKSNQSHSQTNHFITTNSNSENERFLDSESFLKNFQTLIVGT